MQKRIPLPISTVLTLAEKSVFLASLAFGKHVYPKEVYTEGISKITLEDVAYAQNAGYVVKLIGQAKRLEGGKKRGNGKPCLCSCGKPAVRCG